MFKVWRRGGGGGGGWQRKGREEPGMSALIQAFHPRTTQYVSIKMSANQNHFPLGQVSTRAMVLRLQNEN